MQERQTMQKRVIYDALRALDHPTATEVYKYLHERYPTVSRATVFRVLSGFAGSGKAAEVKMAGADTRYDSRIEKHSHAHCRACGKIVDVPFDPSSALPDVRELVGETGFSVDGLRVEFFGICPACRADRKNSDDGR